MKVLFILGIGQDYKPERWESKHHVYGHLAKGLEKLGIEHHLFANPASIKNKYLLPHHYSLSDSNTLKDLIDKGEYTHAFIWGGRTDADRSIRDQLEVRKIRCIYSEAGWFPQSGHCYFSEHGTNAECQLSLEGLHEHIFDARAFHSARRATLCNLLGLWNGLKVPAMKGRVCMDISKPILLPLQDENDTNILLSSPLRSMTEFVRLFAERYPDVQFIARPHPRSPVRVDLGLRNLTIQNPKTNPFLKHQTYGGIIGINSTTLLQFSLLGLPVCGIGSGIGTGNGAYHDLMIDSLPSSLANISCDLDQASKFYDFMIRKKQLKSAHLSRKEYLRNTYILKYFGI